MIPKMPVHHRDGFIPCLARAAELHWAQEANPNLDHLTAFSIESIDGGMRLGWPINSWSEWRRAFTSICGEVTPSALQWAIILVERSTPEGVQVPWWKAHREGYPVGCLPISKAVFTARDVLAHAQGADLTRLNLCDVALPNLDVAGGSLDGLRISQCTIEHLGLSGATMRGARIFDCDVNIVADNRLTFPKPVMRGAEFENCRIGGVFMHCDLREVTFRRVYKTPAPVTVTASFIGCDLRECTFEDVDLTGARFTDCDLSGVDLTDCRVDPASFTDCNLEETGIKEAA